MRREISNEFPNEGPLFETSNFMCDLFTLQSSQTDLHLYVLLEISIKTSTCLFSEENGLHAWHMTILVVAQHILHR